MNSFCVPLHFSSVCPHLNAHFAWQLGRSPAFSLSTLKMWFYCLLASAAAAEKSCLHHIGSFVHNLLFVLWSLLILSLLSLMFHCEMTRCGFNYISFALDFFLFFYPEVLFISSGLLIISPPPPSVWSISYRPFLLFTHYGNPDKNWKLHSSLVPHFFLSR